MIYDVLIIGGGASGLACAAKCAMNGLKCAILERGEKTGKKLMVTGNGRCNLTNMNMSVDNFHSDSSEIVAEIIKKYPPNKIIAFFESIGLITREKNNYVYPYSNQASCVVDAFALCLRNFGVFEVFNFQAVEIYNKNNCYFVSNEEGKSYRGKNIVVASGAKAYNGSGAGSGILKSFGHELIPFYPAIVQLKSESAFIKGLKGVRFSGRAKAFCNGKMVAEENGEILFTEYGISGIAIMQLSRLFSKSDKMSIFLDFMADKTFDEVVDILDFKKNYICANELSEELFTGMLNKSLGRNILIQLGLNKHSLEKINLKEIKKIASSIKSMEIEIKSTNGFKNAQACGGGIKLDDFNSALESNLSKGLYACGEVLDVLGDCGGYNLHWAWASGLIVAEGIIKKTGESHVKNS